MDTQNILTLIGIGVVVLGAFITLIYKIGMNVTKMRETHRRVGNVEGDVGEIKTDVKSLLVKTEGWGVKIDALWRGGLTASDSPRVLNELGEKILADSGIKDIIDARYEEILTKVKGMDHSNAYQAEECVIKVVKDLGQEDDLISTLQDSAFNSGIDVESLLLVGAIYIRDTILAELGYDISQINSNKPKKTTA